MLAAHQQSIRLLQGVLIASATLPAMLFAYASWQGYNTTKNVAERQIAQSRDVLTEHALKVFEAVDRSIAETNEIIRDMSDVQIAENADKLHYRLKKLADGSSQIKSLWIFDRSGHAIVNSLEFPSPPIDFSDRDYFKAHVERDIGTMWATCCSHDHLMAARRFLELATAALRPTAVSQALSRHPYCPNISKASTPRSAASPAATTL
jgi:two-component system NtrC family sensor kinase